MKKAKNYNKKRAAIVLTGTLAFTGAVSAIPMPDAWKSDGCSCLCG